MDEAAGHPAAGLTLIHACTGLSPTLGAAFCVLCSQCGEPSHRSVCMLLCQCMPVLVRLVYFVGAASRAIGLPGGCVLLKLSKRV